MAGNSDASASHHKKKLENVPIHFWYKVFWQDKDSAYYQRDVLLTSALDFHIAAKEKCSFVYDPKSEEWEMSRQA